MPAARAIRFICAKKKAQDAAAIPNANPANPEHWNPDSRLAIDTVKYDIQIKKNSNQNPIFAFILMKMDQKTEDFYNRLRDELNESTASWPTEYLYKFIMPSVADNTERVENAFNGMGAVIKTSKSKTGKFTSVSINVQMASAQAIIDKYLEVSTIEGIVSL